MTLPEAEQTFFFAALAQLEPTLRPVFAERVAQILGAHPDPGPDVQLRRFRWSNFPNRYQSSTQAGDEFHLPLNGNAVTDPVQNGVGVAHRQVDNHAAEKVLQCLPGPRFGSRAGLHPPPVDRETHVDGLMPVEDGAQGGERDRALHLHPRKRASHRRDRDRVPGEGGCQGSAEVRRDK